MSKIYIETKELLSKYGVSNVTVAKWIRETQIGLTGLKYEIVGKRCKFLDIVENWFILDKLGEEAATKRSMIFSEEITPSKEFYEIFSYSEILEIIRDLRIRNMINFKFSYKGQGGRYWNNFYNENYISKIYQAPVWTEEILNYYSPILINKLKEYNTVNLIDLGPGNGKPVLKFIQKLNTQTNLKRYIPVDISDKLLELSVNNIKSALPHVECIPFKKDFERDRLDDIFGFGIGKDQKTMNLVTILGAILPNTYDAEIILKNIQKTMNSEDILLIDDVKNKIENNLNFEYFQDMNSDVVKQQTWIAKSLGISLENSKYITEYDNVTKQKFSYLLLDRDYKIKFVLPNNHFVSVDLKKNSKLVSWFAFDSNPDSYSYILDKTNLSQIDSLTLPNDMHFIISARSKEERIKNPFVK
jgi:uncharacterized SAM-dependent methyltransferase